MKTLLLASLVLLLGCDNNKGFDRESNSDFIVGQNGKLILLCKVGERVKHPNGSIWRTDACGPGLQQTEINKNGTPKDYSYMLR